MYPYHRIHQSHADFLMLDVGIIQSDGDFHLIKYVKGVLLNFQSGALKHTCRRPLDTLIDGAPVTPNTWIHTASSKTRFGANLSLVSKKTVPSRPNLGMRMMIAFFLTNKTNPSSCRMLLLLKNNWKETVCVKARLTLKSCCFELALPACGRPQKLFVHTGPFYVCSWGCWKGQTACVCPSNLGRWYLLL